MLRLAHRVLVLRHGRVVAHCSTGSSTVDALVANHDSNNISFLPGMGAAGVGPAMETPVGVGPSAVLAADFNGDNLLDVAAVNTGGGTASIFLQACR